MLLLIFAAANIIAIFMGAIALYGEPMRGYRAVVAVPTCAPICTAALAPRLQEPPMAEPEPFDLLARHLYAPPYWRIVDALMISSVGLLLAAVLIVVVRGLTPCLRGAAE